MKLDILAIGVHPDDVELSCAGTIAKHVEAGKKVGILDLTKGEMGTRGTIETRKQEAADAAKILGLSTRENIGIEDAFFENNKVNQIKIIEVIRKYQPAIILANATSDRHPDHGRGAKLISDACFYSGLAKIETGQQPWRPNAVYHFIQDRFIQPDFVIDVTNFLEIKIKSIMAYKTQFYNPESKEPQTPISGEDFIEFIKARMRTFGRDAGFKYAEGYTTERVIGVNLLDSII